MYSTSTAIQILFLITIRCLRIHYRAGLLVLYITIQLMEIPFKANQDAIYNAFLLDITAYVLLGLVLVQQQVAVTSRSLLQNWCIGFSPLVMQIQYTQVCSNQPCRTKTREITNLCVLDFCIGFVTCDENPIHRTFRKIAYFFHLCLGIPLPTQ